MCIHIYYCESLVVLPVLRMPFLWPNCSGIQEQDWPPPLPLSKTQHRFQAGFRHNVRLAFHHITTNQRTSLQKDSSRLHTILVRAFRERERERERERGIGGKNMIIDTTYLQIVFPEREKERNRRKKHDYWYNLPQNSFPHENNLYWALDPPSTLSSQHSAWLSMIPEKKTKLHAMQNVKNMAIWFYSIYFCKLSSY